MRLSLLLIGLIVLTGCKNTPSAAPQTEPVPVIPAPVAIEKPAIHTVTDAFPELPAARNGAVLLFVFDDAGANLPLLQTYLDLPFPATFAVLPYFPRSAEAARRIRLAGKELLLHQPMQPQKASSSPAPGTLKPDMPADSVIGIIRRNLEKIGPVKGMNNHEGSLFTESEAAMASVLSACAEAGIYFLDSRTTAASAAPAAAAEKGMSIWQQDIFLDNSPKREDMLTELRRGLEKANKRGYAVLIGHVRRGELSGLLKEVYPALREKGYRFSVPSQMQH